MSANDVTTAIHTVATSQVIDKMSVNSTTGSTTLTVSSVPVFVATTATSTTIPLHTILLLHKQQLVESVQLLQVRRVIYLSFQLL